MIQIIKCPECGTVQQANIVATDYWNVYIHECSCGYVITESEWEVKNE